jgi:hypothetical protein
MATAKKTKTAASAKKKVSKTTAKKQTARPAPALDWAATIKKAAADKRTQASWPGGAGDGWKKKTRI